MRRPGEVIELREIEKDLPGISPKIHFIEAPLLEISSNQIRKLVSESKPFRYYLPKVVYDIVVRQGLYLQTENNNQDN